jgi:hypothetical protein
MLYTLFEVRSLVKATGLTLKLGLGIEMACPTVWAYCLTFEASTVSGTPCLFGWAVFPFGYNTNLFK